MFGIVEVVDDTVCITIEGTAALVVTGFRGWRSPLPGLDEICSTL
jgi:hypothetical protein